MTTASASHVELIHGAGGWAVFWQVGGSATLGTTTDFQGTIMAMTSITMTTGATIGVGGIGNGGRALAREGALTLDTNVIIPPPAGCVATSPSPSSPGGAPVVGVTPAGVPVFGAPSVPSLPGLPDTSMTAQVAEPNLIVLPALIGAALLAGMFRATLRKGRRA